MRLLILLLFASLSFQGLCSDAFSANRPTEGNMLGLTSSNAQQFLPVEEAYQLSVELIDPQRLRFYWHIAPDYYLYKHRFKWQVWDDAKLLEVNALFPPAIKHEDEYFGAVEVYYTFADITLTLPKNSGNLTIDVVSQGCADAGLCYPPYTQRFTVDVPGGKIQSLQIRGPGSNSDSVEKTVSPSSLMSLFYMALLAFIGGSILNLMPCVFPVLSLKVLSFAQSEAHDRHLHSWVYTAGVVSSFVLVAAVLIALQEAGTAVGWGFQLQSPIFVVLMAYLFVVMGLGLSGLTEIGAQWMGLGSQLANRGGPSGSFFTGVLATLVASPCTAPFMGTAIGFAIGQPAAISLTIFAALGLGMATPMVLLGYSSGLRRLMPKPGPWMQTFRQALAFPLYATAIWLLWIAGRQTGVNGMAVALTGCLLLVLTVWLWQHSGWRKIIASLAAIVAILLLTSPQFDTRTKLESGNTGQYSPQRLRQLLSEGRAVFINVTADWCITCIANESTTLSSREVLDAFKQKNISYLKADWTNYDENIAKLLRQHQRTSIPLYLLYPGNRNQTALILPQLLSTATVLEYLDKI